MNWSDPETINIKHKEDEGFSLTPSIVILSYKYHIYLLVFGIPINTINIPTFPGG